MKTTDSAQVERIYFAGGCFWGTQHLLKSLHGIRSAVCGYANSLVKDPSYDEVKTGSTGAVEAVMAEYNATVVDLRRLIAFFLRSIDPIAVNRQGNDVGTQYRTGIYYTTDAQKEAARKEIERLQKHYDKPVAVEVLPLKNFTPAEEVHQDYLEKNPGGYCHLSRELMAEAHSYDILKPQAPADADHADADYADEAAHPAAGGCLYENDALYPDTHYRNKPGE